jgi:hypothetical protein
MIYELLITFDMITSGGEGNEPGIVGYPIPFGMEEMRFLVYCFAGCR